jgi:hypothetical protein
MRDNSGDIFLAEGKGSITEEGVGLALLVRGVLGEKR